MGGSGWNPRQGKDQPSISFSPLDAASSELHPHILLLEDNKADVFLIREAIAAAKVSANLHVLNDAEAAIQLIDQADADDAAPCPVLFLIDLNLPKKSGAEVLRHVRQSRRCADARVVIVTSSDSDRDRAEAAQLGANEYFRKPSTYAAYIVLGELVRRMLGGR